MFIHIIIYVYIYYLYIFLYEKFFPEYVSRVVSTCFVLLWFRMRRGKNSFYSGQLIELWYLRMRSNQRGNQYKRKVVLVWLFKVPLHGAWFGVSGLLIVSVSDRGTSPRIEGIKHTGKNRIRVCSTQKASIISFKRYDEIQWSETDSFVANR